MKNFLFELLDEYKFRPGINAFAYFHSLCRLSEQITFTKANYKQLIKIFNLQFNEIQLKQKKSRVGDSHLYITEMRNSIVDCLVNSSDLDSAELITNVINLLPSVIELDESASIEKLLLHNGTEIFVAISSKYLMQTKQKSVIIIKLIK